MKLLLSILLFPIALIRLLLMIFVSFLFVIIVFIEDSIHRITQKKYSYFSLHLWGYIMLLILGIIVKRNKKLPSGTYIIMPNHRSYIDIFLMAAYAPASFVAKAELQKWPFIGQAIKAAKIITVQRKELRSLLATMNKIRTHIENNLSVLVFPEGTTGTGPGVKPFKSGTFKIASEIKASIIPCAIAYKNPKLAWVDDDTFTRHFFREMWCPVSKAFVCFGTALFSTDYSELESKTKESIQDMLRSIEKN